MTGAVTTVWFLGKRRTRPNPDSTAGVSLDKPRERTEAEQALKDSAARHDAVRSQRGRVAKTVRSLAEIREQNHFAESIRTAMLGGER